jgi:hypothetical protein
LNQWHLGKCAIALATVFWLQHAALGDDPGFQSIFDGRSLDGWLGQDMRFWSVEDGAITGTITPELAPPMNQYLVWQGGLVDDFELKLDSRITGSTTPNTNGGFQFRSRRLPNGDVAGYQVDNNFGQPWRVRLYDEFGRHDLALEGQRSVFDASGQRHVEPLSIPADAQKFRLDDWHEYHLTARGNHLALAINGTLVAECTDNDPQQFEPLGILALQLHTGPPMKAQFRNVRIKQLTPEHPPTPRQHLMATAAFDWQLGERLSAHLPPLELHGQLDAEKTADGPDADPTAKVARLEGAYLDAGVAWNTPGDALTVYVRVRMPDGNWSQPLFSKGAGENLNFRLFSEDLPSTPGPDVAFEVRTRERTHRVAFPLSHVDPKAWHDVVARYTGQNLELICDGKAMTRLDVRGELSASDQPLLIGGELADGRANRTFTGELQEVALWTRSLNDDELKLLETPGKKGTGTFSGTLAK